MNRFEGGPNPEQDLIWLKQQLAQLEARLMRSTDDHDRYELQDQVRTIRNKIARIEGKMAA